MLDWAVVGDFLAARGQLHITCQLSTLSYGFHVERSLKMPSVLLIDVSRAHCDCGVEILPLLLSQISIFSLDANSSL